MTNDSRFTLDGYSIPDSKGSVLNPANCKRVNSWIICLTSRTIYSHFPRSLCVDRNYRTLATPDELLQAEKRYPTLAAYIVAQDVLL